MCDDSDFDRMRDYFRRTQLSRRQFGALSVGAALGSVVPAIADARELQVSEVDIPTPDGTCDAYFAHPAKGTWPAVLVWPDIMGLRPAFKQMAQRLAQSGFAVLVVNPFYRMRRAPTSPEHPDLDDPATRAAVMGMAAGLTAQTAATDANALVPWLDNQVAVNKQRRMASAGYCFGGPYTLRTAAAFPDRVRAIASFHGAPMVTDKADSAHLLIQKINVHALIAIAESDDKQQPGVKTVLREAFDRAHLPAEIEVYAGALHGWCPPDSRAYNHEQAEKAWARQLAVFKQGLA
ncbi:MAG: dienelactone hydrolase [Gammaproteobacteria bacterium]|nr:dienelactone hydrolase [Gammaproteobacteria bacterium]